MPSGILCALIRTEEEARRATLAGFLNVCKCAEKRPVGLAGLSVWFLQKLLRDWRDHISDVPRILIFNLLTLIPEDSRKRKQSE